MTFIVKVTTKAFYPPAEAAVVRQQTDGEANPNTAEQPESTTVNVSIGNEQGLRLDSGDHDMSKSVRETIQQSVLQIVWLPMHIFVISFSAILIALLYLKTRQTGGECTHEFLARFEEVEPSRKKWQERVRQRLIQSGRVTSKS